MRLSRLGRMHFVGIGGIGMSGIAEVLLTMGYTVSGSDLQPSPVTDRLKSLGAQVFFGHAPEHVGEAQVVVYSSAVHRDNPEVAEASRLGVPAIPRAEMLAELMRMKSCITVAGTHGKTTVTAMLAHLADGSNMDATVVIGGRLSTIGTSARLGKSDLMVAEADESDRSFLLLFPTIAVITNIEWDHVDCYPTLQDLRDAFLQFANNVPFYGSCVVNGDDANLRAILPRMNRRTVSFGMKEGNDYQAVRENSEGSRERFEVLHSGAPLGEIRLPHPGRHNVMNALCVVAVAREMGIPIETVAESLATFPGADRRFELKGEAAGIRVIDDYGHHPTEVEATLEAGRRSSRGGRLAVAFQPHRYSRLEAFQEDFARSLLSADLLFVTEVYPAGEAPIPGVSGEMLYERIRQLGHGAVHYCADVEDLAGAAAPRLREGDLFIILGAGNITRAAGPVLDLLGREKEP